MAKGGRRPGAGRKRKEKIPPTKRAIATEILDLFGKKYNGKQLPTLIAFWHSLLFSTDENIRLKAIIYLTDRDGGKPTQPMDHGAGGPVQVIIETNVRMADPHGE